MKPTSTNEAHSWLPAPSLFKAAAIRVHSGLLPEGALLTPRFALTFALTFALAFALTFPFSFAFRALPLSLGLTLDGKEAFRLFHIEKMLSSIHVSD